MSGAQTYSEMIEQPSATNSELATAVYPILIPGVNGGPATTLLATLAQISEVLGGGGSGAVSSVVNQIGAITAAQISGAIAGSGLTVSGGQLVPTFPVSSVAGQTGTITSTQLATALAGSGLTVVSGQLTASGGGGAVSSVVGQTGAITSTQIATALAGSGLTVVGGQLTASGGGGAVSSVVGQTGAVTSTQIATALAGSGLTVSGGQLVASFPAGALPLTGGTLTGPLVLSASPTSALQAATKGYVDAIGAVSSVVGQTGTVTASQIATAIAGSGITVVGGQITTTPGTAPVTAVGSVSSYALAYATSGNNAYDFTLAQNVTFTMTGGTTGQFQRLTVILRQPSAGNIVVTLPSNVKYSGGSAPTVGTSGNAITVITFGTSDGGTTYFGGL